MRKKDINISVVELVLEDKIVVEPQIPNINFSNP